MQRGCIFWREEKNAWFLKYRATELNNGTPQRVHKSIRLCTPNGKEHHPLCEAKNEEHRLRRDKAGRVIVPKNLEPLRDKILKTARVNEQSAGRAGQDMSIADFWEQRYLPYCEEILPLTGKSRKRASTMQSYKQIWRQHLAAHFGKLLLHEYEPAMGKRFLRGLTGTQCKATLKHIKSLAGSLFSHAVDEELIKVNPWHDVRIPDAAIESPRTQHYTLEEAENIISALVDHVDCQLIMALSCFLGLRPGEIAGLRWEDFDSECVHIRRSVVRGHLDVPKTLESVADLPLLDPRILIPLKLWHEKCGQPKEGFLFRNADGSHLHNLNGIVGRKIRPIVKAAGLQWKGLYAGRRGAATAAVEVSSAAVAQQLLRHKSMTTTLNIYKKAISDEAFRAGMKKLAAANGKEER